MGVVRDPPQTRRSRLTTAVLVAAALHLLVLPLIARDDLFQSPKAPPRRAQVSLSQIPRSQVMRAQGPPGSMPTPGSTLSQAPKLPPAPPALLEVEPKKPDPVEGQVVSIGQPKDERAPEKATKFLSEKDSRVEKETRAKETSAFFKNALSKVQKEGKDSGAQKKAEAHPAAPPQVAGEQGEKGGQKQQLVAKREEARLPEQKPRDKLQIAEAEGGTVQNRSSSEAVPGEGRKLAMVTPDLKQNGASSQGEGLGKPGAPGGPGELKSLNLSLQDLGAALGPVAGGPMNDDLRGLEEGEETLLNSRSFRYAGFLNRVKEQVGRIWVTKVQDESSRRDPTGQLYSFKDRRTVVEFTLDHNGDLQDVKVRNSSGVDYLDRVAVDAFKKAERFPNPPAGLAGADGTIRLPFAFTLLAAQGGLRLSVGPAYLPGSPAQRGF